MDNEPNGRNKRLSERVRIIASKQIWNLSEGGAYVSTDSPRKLGSLLHFEFRLGVEMPAFQALSKVVRVLHRKNHKTQEPRGMAVQFVKVSETDLSNLQKYLNYKKMQTKVTKFHEESGTS